ncbi:MAG: hypothetical protein AB2693_11775 [Candidatus Thiodiazotropha sp.]
MLVELGQGGKGSFRNHLWCPNDLVKLWDRIDGIDRYRIYSFARTIEPSVASVSLVRNAECRLEQAQIPGRRDFLLKNRLDSEPEEAQRNRTSTSESYEKSSHHQQNLEIVPRPQRLKKKSEKKN